VVAEGQVAQRRVPAAVNKEVPAGPAYIEEILVDRQAVDVGVDILFGEAEPGGVVDEFFEDGVAGDDILEIDAVFLTVAMGFYAADPAGVFFVAGGFYVILMVVDPLVHGV
jgi:hypothetical protein